MTPPQDTPKGWGQRAGPFWQLPTAQAPHPRRQAGWGVRSLRSPCASVSLGGIWVLGRVRGACPPLTPPCPLTPSQAEEALPDQACPDPADHRQVGLPGLRQHPAEGGEEEEVEEGGRHGAHALRRGCGTATRRLTSHATPGLVPKPPPRREFNPEIELIPIQSAPGRSPPHFTPRSPRGSDPPHPPQPVARRPPC